jgi:filamentous hemagglutinin family protein
MTANNNNSYRPFTFRNFIVLCATILATSSGFANPAGGTVTNGDATITQAPNTTTINQSSQQAIIEWQSFNIGAKETTHFQQPANGVALNRINANQGMSQIFGTITATGKIILVNGAGIYFGPGAMINVGGLIASTSNISNANFLAGKYIFDQPSPFHAGIVNEGIIHAADYGLVALIGSTVTNRGMIQAELGSVVLATGDKFTLDFYGDQLINFSIDARASAGGKILNTGTLLADGGKILVTAAAAQGVLDNIIDMEGVAQAHSVGQQNGQIILAAEYGDVNVSGTIDTSAKIAGLQAGNIQISADKVTIASIGKLLADGDKGGGNISLAVNTIVIDSTLSAQGTGKTAVGGNITISANTINLMHNALLNVSGNAGGGSVALGGTSTKNPQAEYIGLASASQILTTALTTGKSGNVTLMGDTISAAGLIAAQGVGAASVGGSVVASANSFVMNGASIIASGNAGGGNVTVTGENTATSALPYINIDTNSVIVADATVSGNAGKIDLSADTIDLSGSLSAQAKGTTSLGGTISLAANTFVAEGAQINVNAGAGNGSVSVVAIAPSATNPTYVTIDTKSVITANANNTGVAGSINLLSDNITVAGTLSAQGVGDTAVGGSLQIAANTSVANGASLNVSGNGGGGNIHVAKQNPATQTYINIDSRSVILADAVKGGNAGTLNLIGDNITIAGNVSAQGLSANTLGGNITVAANSFIANGANMNVSGSSGGGNVTISKQNPVATAPAYINVSAGSVILANAVTSGKGGTINFAADNITIAGNVSAQGVGASALGGTINVAANNFLAVGATLNVSAKTAAGGISVAGMTGAKNAAYIGLDNASYIYADASGANSVGGSIKLYGDGVSIAGTLSAQGAGVNSVGGDIAVHGNKITVARASIINANADFIAGDLVIGGNPYATTTNTASQTVSINMASTLSAEATGNGGNGGNISISGVNTTIGGTLDVSAMQAAADGGVINVTGTNIEITNKAFLNANGQQDGGEISLGGTPAAVQTTASVNVDTGSTLTATAAAESNLQQGRPVGGSIQIYATNTTINGTLDVSATNVGAQAGEVDVFANNTVNLGAFATINAQGDFGGGTVLIGGDTHGSGMDPNAQFTDLALGSVINASSVNNGSGGNITVWSDNTTNFSGSIIARGGVSSGNGGEVEVSGKEVLHTQGTVDLTAAQGNTGTLTLDPQNITIQTLGGTSDANNSVITVASLESLLATANVMLITATTGNQPGDIVVANNVTWDNTNTLTLSAYRDVDINANINNNRGGSLTVIADNTKDGVGTINFGNNASVNMSGGGQVNMTYEPQNNNYRYPNTYASNVHVSNGTTANYYPLNYVTPADNNAIISSMNVLPNVESLDLSLALGQEPLEVIVPEDNGVMVAMETNLYTITETSAPSVGVRLMDQPSGSGCGQSADCVSSDFVIE